MNIQIYFQFPNIGISLYLSRLPQSDDLPKFTLHLIDFHGTHIKLQLADLLYMSRLAFHPNFPFCYFHDNLKVVQESSNTEENLVIFDEAKETLINLVKNGNVEEVFLVGVWLADIFQNGMKRNVFESNLNDITIAALYKMVNNREDYFSCDDRENRVPIRYYQSPLKSFIMFVNNELHGVIHKRLSGDKDMTEYVYSFLKSFSGFCGLKKLKAKELKRYFSDISVQEEIMCKLVSLDQRNKGNHEYDSFKYQLSESLIKNPFVLFINNCTENVFDFSRGKWYLKIKNLS